MFAQMNRIRDVVTLLESEGAVFIVPFSPEKLGGPQCSEMILNKIEKTFNKTCTGLKSFYQGFQI